MRVPGVLARRPARPCAVAFSSVCGAAVRAPQSREVIDGGGGSFSGRSATGQGGHAGCSSGAVPASPVGWSTSRASRQVPFSPGFRGVAAVGPASTGRQGFRTSHSESGRHRPGVSTGAIRHRGYRPAEWHRLRPGHPRPEPGGRCSTPSIGTSRPRVRSSPPCASMGSTSPASATTPSSAWSWATS